MTYARLRDTITVLAFVGLVASFVAIAWRIATGGLEWGDTIVTDVVKFVVDFYAPVLSQIVAFYLARLAASKSLGRARITIPVWLPLGIVGVWALLPPFVILVIRAIE